MDSRKEPPRGMGSDEHDEVLHTPDRGVRSHSAHPPPPVIPVVFLGFFVHYSISAQ